MLKISDYLFATLIPLLAILLTCAVIRVLSNDLYQMQNIREELKECLPLEPGNFQDTPASIPRAYARSSF